jgi:predicted phosphodiesterase
MSKVFTVADLHLPFHDRKALRKVLRAVRIEKPTVVIQIGDLLDQYCFSKYVRSLNLSVPAKEIRKGLKLAAWFWSEVHKIVPRARRIQILGNHDVRICKRIGEKLPELEGLLGIGSLYQFPGVEVMKSDRDYVVIDGVLYTHGHYSNSIDHVKFYLKSVVHGHLHRAGLNTYGKLWAMDVGHMANEGSLPLSYTASRVSRWAKAYGITDNGNPRLELL